MTLHRGTPEDVAAKVRAKAGEIEAIAKAIAPSLEELGRLNVDLALLLRQVDPGDSEVDRLILSVKSLVADMTTMSKVLCCCRALRDYGLDRVVVEAMRRRGEGRIPNAEGGSRNAEGEEHAGACDLARSVA